MQLESDVVSPISISHPFRSRPQITTGKPDLPSSPPAVRVCHPDNGYVFLVLAAYDHLPGSTEPVQLGLHHETVLTACMIVAYNRAGYLSSSRDRHDDHIQVSQHPFILPNSYYYHLIDAETKVPYPICPDFQTWSFPHKNLPSSWSSHSSQAHTDLLSDWPSNWTAISLMVKIRDQFCLVSRSKEYLTSAHVIPKDQIGRASCRERV